MSKFFNIKMSKKSDFNLSFLVDVGKTKWYNEDNKEDDFLNKDFKYKIPKCKIFEINSLIYNLAKHKKEVLAKYNCFYDENNNSLSLIIDENFCFSYFTKEIMINFLEFSQKIGIDAIYFLISKKNSQYIKIVQDLMIVGLEIDDNIKSINIEGNNYKVLVLPIKEEFDEIEEIFF